MIMHAMFVLHPRGRHRREREEKPDPLNDPWLGFNASKRAKPLRGAGSPAFPVTATATLRAPNNGVLSNDAYSANSMCFACVWILSCVPFPASLPAGRTDKPLMG